MSSADLSLSEAVDRLRERDRRFGREAYPFVVAALAVAVERLPSERLRDPVRRHLTGPELLRAVVALARAEFGPLAATVFHEWGVLRGEDVGVIVFQLVGSGQLSARPEDRLEDFGGGPDLLRALGGRAASPAGDAE